MGTFNLGTFIYGRLDVCHVALAHKASNRGRRHFRLGDRPRVSGCFLCDQSRWIRAAAMVDRRHGVSLGRAAGLAYSE